MRPLQSSERVTAFRTILEQSLGLRQQDDLLLVYDESFNRYLSEIDQAIEDLAINATCVRIPLAEQKRLVRVHGESEGNRTSLPPGLEAALLHSSNILNVLGATTTTLPFRRAIVQARPNDSRLAHIPGVSEEILDVMLRTPLDSVETMCEALAWILSEADHASLHTFDRNGGEHVLNMRLGKWENEAIMSPGIIARGSWGNIPPGEVFCCPDPDTVGGSVCINGSVEGHVLEESEEAILSFATGRMTWTCSPGSPVEKLFARESTQAAQVGDDKWDTFAELGIGLNSAITSLTGNPLFDEKAIETVHIAFGDNSGFGHDVVSRTHQDLVIRQPTLIVDGKVVLERGKITIDTGLQRRPSIPLICPLPVNAIVSVRENRCQEEESILRRRLVSGNRIGIVKLAPDDETYPLARMLEIIRTYNKVSLSRLYGEHAEVEGVPTSKLVGILYHYRMLNCK